MKPKIIKSEEAYASALKVVDQLMDAEPGSPEEDDLELWSLLVEEYEKRHYPMDSLDPIEAIKFRMDQMGLQQKDLTKYIPAKSKVSEVINRKRPLSLAMIRALHKHLGIPAEVLVREPKAECGIESRSGKSTSSQSLARKSPARKAARKAATK